MTTNTQLCGTPSIISIVYYVCVGWLATQPTSPPHPSSLSPLRSCSPPASVLLTSKTSLPVPWASAGERAHTCSYCLSCSTGSYRHSCTHVAAGELNNHCGSHFLLLVMLLLHVHEVVMGPLHACTLTLFCSTRWPQQPLHVIINIDCCFCVADGASNVWWIPMVSSSALPPACQPTPESECGGRESWDSCMHSPSPAAHSSQIL